MKVTYRNKEWELPGGMTVRDLIRKVGLQPELVLAVRDGKLLTEDVIVQEADQIKLVAVISGGSPVIYDEV
jgi:sulfur carrier protein ThiS